MTRGDVTAVASAEQLGLAHVALVIGTEADLDALAARRRDDGVAILDGRGAPAMATTNASRAIPKATASRSPPVRLRTSARDQEGPR
jgi:hypothetical protein